MKDENKEDLISRLGGNANEVVDLDLAMMSKPEHWPNKWHNPVVKLFRSVILGLLRQRSIPTLVLKRPKEDGQWEFALLSHFQLKQAKGFVIPLITQCWLFSTPSHPEPLKGGFEMLELIRQQGWIVDLEQWRGYD